MPQKPHFNSLIRHAFSKNRMMRIDCWRWFYCQHPIRVSVSVVIRENWARSANIILICIIVHETFPHSNCGATQYECNNAPMQNKMKLSMKLLCWSNQNCLLSPSLARQYTMFQSNPLHDDSERMPQNNISILLYGCTWTWFVRKIHLFFSSRFISIMVAVMVVAATKTIATATGAKRFL